MNGTDTAAYEPSGVTTTAQEAPGRPAVLSARGGRNFGELDARSNRLARALRARGVGAGDGVALVCSNRPEFVETVHASERSGVRLTPINWHLSADEVTYILGDCGAKVVIAEDRFAEVAASAAKAAGVTHRLAVGGEIPGFGDYEAAVAGEGAEPIDDPSPGFPMYYTSGTTGRPKGVLRRPPTATARMVAELGRFQGGKDLAIVTGPLYHAAPLGLNLQPPLSVGCAVYLMDGFDPEQFLRLVEEHRATHTHMVPTMFHRLLALPEAVRKGYDVSSLRYVLHGAAPCPVHVKRAMIEWLGPIVHEYYAATEGGTVSISAQEWLEKPGSVGRPRVQLVEIRSDRGDPVPPGQVGTVWFERPEAGDFQYHRDPEKTATTYDPSGRWFTLGDHGYVDDDGYLFLTGRSAEVIISGGVNIYPAEVDAVLLMHEAVADAAAIGVPDDEWGESVRAAVELRDGAEPSDGLAAELVEFCRSRLAHYKCPRGVDFVSSLPRSEAGKIRRGEVRARYWS